MKTSFNTLFLSDMHLGFHGCRAEELIALLESTKADKVVLLGDIIDLWALRASWYWPETHTRVLELLLKKARKGTQIVFVPGNHDHDLRKFCGMTIGNISIEKEHVHTCADGTRLLGIHGDELDAVLQRHMWLAKLGSWAYDWLLALSTHISRARDAAGRVHWSLSKYLKNKVKSAVNYVGDYEKRVVALALSRDVEGIICGHIHTPCLTAIEGVMYANCGDWVESLSYIVEHKDGRLELICGS